MTALAFTFLVLPLRRRFSDGIPKFVFPTIVSAMLIGIALYAAIGQPDAVLNETAVRPAPQSNTDTASKEKLESVNQLLAGLEERLRNNPGDGKGWLLLAKSYDHLGYREESLSAYARARELGVDDAEFAKRISEQSPAIQYPLDSDEVEKVSSLVD